ncbi:MAG TPA: branched-chain amino acid ABC transporter permease, partial [Stellaceae bacterium]|nr:branched-chain amino acid ABC transporter permease [Stellaceae bacterium]
MGSVPGAYIAALIIAELQALLLIVPPFHLLGLDVELARMTLVPGFLVMAAVLILRPNGLLGRATARARGAAGLREPLISAAPPALRRLAWAALGVALIVPLFAGDYAVSILTELAIFVLFAASLHFIMGPGGMASFGHAAYFGLGSYGVALAVRFWALPMAGALPLAPLLAGVGGLIFGWFVVRLSGVYLAMLTLAFAQIVWSVAFQSVSLTGGDNGILGVWPSEWARGRLTYYYLALVLCLGGTLLLRRVIHAPLGYALRAGRDAPQRAEAIGINVAALQWAGFVLAAAGAGLAGGLFAFFKGSVFPTYLDIPRSVDALLMVLLGGVQTVSGPIVGALVYAGLEEQLIRLTDYWRIVLGFAIILLVLAFPEGIAGFVQRRWGRAAS